MGWRPMKRPALPEAMPKRHVIALSRRQLTAVIPATVAAAIG